MNAAALSSAISRRALLAVGTLRIPVTITDARYVFGRVDYCVTPENGSGKDWIDSGRVKIGGNHA